MADKQLLKDMLSSMINDDPESATVSFNEYLQDKVREIVNPNSVVSEAAHYKKMGYENEEEMMDDMEYDRDDMDGYNGMMDDMDDESSEKLSHKIDDMEHDDMRNYIKELVSSYMKRMKDDDYDEENEY